jgi:hypothetical protein
VVQEGHFYAASRTEPLASSTVRAAVEGVGQIFKAYNLPDPRLDGQKNTSFLLLRQYKGYANLEPGENQQKSITNSVLRNIYCVVTTPLLIAISQLLVAAFFFAMRSFVPVDIRG